MPRTLRNVRRDPRSFRRDSTSFSTRSSLETTAAAAVGLLATLLMGFLWGLRAGARGLRRHRSWVRGRVLWGHEGKAGAMRIVAGRARTARAIAQPESGRQTVDPRAPFAELVAVAGAAELVSFVEADERAVGQMKLVDRVLRVAPVAPAALRAVIQHLLRMKLRQAALLRVGRAAGVAARAGERGQQRLAR